jgi:predicted ATPase
VTEDIVALLLGKIQDLAPASRRALVLASCFGHEFDLEALGALSGRTAQEVRLDLGGAMSEGLVLPVRPRHGSIRFKDGKHAGSRIYRFSHDRVQQAAYSLLDPRAGQVKGRHLARIEQRIRGGWRGALRAALPHEPRHLRDDRSHRAP